MNITFVRCSRALAGVRHGMAPRAAVYVMLLLLLPVLQPVVGNTLPRLSPAHQGVASCAAAPDGFELVGHGYCVTSVATGGTQRVQASLCVSHECAAYTATSCTALCMKTMGCTGVMVQDMTIYGQPPTCGIVGTTKPTSAAGTWDVENVGQGTNITGHDPETRDCCYRRLSGSKNRSTFAELGNGYCTGPEGRPQTFVCDTTGGKLGCPSDEKACEALCTATPSCTGFMTQRMPNDPNTCNIVSESQPSGSGTWRVYQAGASLAITGHDGETRDTCYKKTGTPSPPPAPPAPPPAPPPPAPSPAPPAGPRYPQAQDMFGVRECVLGNPSQAWVYSAPGLWPNGSFNAHLPNIHSTGNSSIFCVSARGGLPGFWAEVTPCQTTFKTRYWGNNPVASNTLRFNAATGEIWTNVSAHGSLSNMSGRACLRAGLPVPAGVDWSRNTTVSMWWCDGAPESKWKVLAESIVSMAPGGGCLSAIPKPPLPPTPGPPGGECGPVCTDGCDDAECKDLPFCNTKLSWNERAKDLISRVSSQKPNLMMSTAINPPNCLGFSKSWMFFGEAQHGLARNCNDPNDPAQVGICATSFPSLVGIGATYNRTLWRAMGTAISDEARAWYNVAGNRNNVPLTMWAPNINLHRNFLWGRAVETPGNFSGQ